MVLERSNEEERSKQKEECFLRLRSDAARCPASGSSGVCRRHRWCRSTFRSTGLVKGISRDRRIKSEGNGTHESQSFVIEPFNRVEVKNGEDDFGEEIEDEILQVPK